jgi:hypothetical protein
MKYFHVENIMQTPPAIRFIVFNNRPPLLFLIGLNHTNNGLFSMLASLSAKQS